MYLHTFSELGFQSMGVSMNNLAIKSEQETHDASMLEVISRGIRGFQEEQKAG